MRDADKVKTRFELKLDSSQVFFLFLGLVTYSALLFVLGVVVGRSRRADDTLAGQGRLVLPDASPTPTVARVEDRLAAVEPKATEEPELPLGFYENLEKGTTPGVSPSPGKAKPTATPLAATPTPKPVASPSPRLAANPTPASTPPAKGSFTLQVVSYGEETQAEGEVAKLTHQGYKDVFLTQGSVGGKTVHRVRIGHYASKADAEEAATTIAADNPALKPIVVPLD